MKKLTLKSGKGKVSIKIKKAAGAKKYILYRSIRKNKGFNKVKTVKALKYTDKKVTSKKTYYYKVKAISGSYSGAYSKVFKIKVK